LATLPITDEELEKLKQPPADGDPTHVEWLAEHVPSLIARIEAQKELFDLCYSDEHRREQEEYFLRCREDQIGVAERLMQLETTGTPFYEAARRLLNGCPSDKTRCPCGYRDIFEQHECGRR
jgi:hypothetical protein